MTAAEGWKKIRNQEMAANRNQYGLESSVEGLGFGNKVSVMVSMFVFCLESSSLTC